MQEYEKVLNCISHQEKLFKCLNHNEATKCTNNYLLKK